MCLCSGFCLINNVCIGAAYARLEYNLARICIVDIDVHHGNGTEEIVQGDDETLFLSVHQYGNHFFPKFCGATSCCAESNVMNIGLEQGYASKEFKEAINKFCLRIEKFEPQLVLISAGFDGHLNDPIGGANLTEEDYYWATNKLQAAAGKTCEGRLVSVLEGGYDIAALGNCAVAHVSALAGRAFPEKDIKSHAEAAKEKSVSSAQSSLILQVSAAMSSLGKPQSYLAKELNLKSNTMISMWLNNKLPMRGDIDAKMAAWLGTLDPTVVVAKPGPKVKTNNAELEAEAVEMRVQLRHVMDTNKYSQSYVAKQFNSWPSYFSMFFKGRNLPFALHKQVKEWISKQQPSQDEAIDLD